MSKHLPKYYACPIKAGVKNCFEPSNQKQDTIKNSVNGFSLAQLIDRFFGQKHIEIKDCEARKES
jgi:hypothetical protein